MRIKFIIFVEKINIYVNKFKLLSDINIQAVGCQYLHKKCFSTAVHIKFEIQCSLQLLPIKIY